jgi:hypothetical protein
MLPEDEAEALEEAYLAHREVWQRLRGVEDDLLDDYAAGRLASAERGAFESRYFASSPLRERVVAARALRAAVDAGSRRPATPVTVTPVARWGVPLALAASLVLVAVMYIRWPSPPSAVTSIPTSPPSATRTEQPPGPATGEPASPPSPPATEPRRVPAATPLVLALSPVLLRGQEGPPPLIPAGTDVVRLELEGDPALVPPSASSLPVVIETLEGQPVWRGEARREKEAGRPSLLASARVPASQLSPGDYLLTLSSGPVEEGTLYRYFFRVGR